MDHSMVETRTRKKNLMDLPTKVMIEILSRLPVNSICCLACVSKTSLNIIGCPLFATLHMPRLLNSAANSDAAAVLEVPQLMLFGQSWTAYKVMPLQLQLSECTGKYNFRETKYALPVTKFIDGHCSVYFVFCNLIFYKRKDGGNGSRCFLVNPLRGEVLKMPSSPSVEPFFMYRWYGMGFDSITNTYKIVRVFEKASGQKVVAQVYVLGTSLWREIDSVPPCELSHKQNVSAFGETHWFASGGRKCRIISFDFKKEEFYWTTPNPNICNHPAIHLLNLGGSLAIVDPFFNDCIDIWVFKNKREWVLDYKIDTQVCNTNWGVCEHGIFFKIAYSGVCYFLDLRRHSVEAVDLPTIPSEFQPRIYSYTRSLISLKNYGKLVEGGNTGAWQKFAN